uniref:Zinc finger and BTB domain-containing protein 7B n=1 Tax=Gallus gallus TaxID=9031 RepID=A0A8V1AB78_CHICK
MCRFHKVRTMASPEDDLIGIPFPEHSSELLSSLNEQRHLGVLCDVTIKTQGLEYRTHRAVLAACSRYFKKLFAGPGPGQEVCELDFVGPEALGALLEFAYTATLTISSSNMGEVLQAAQLLEIPCVIAACADILQCHGLEAPGPDDDDCERARRYLEAFATLPDGDAPAAPPARPAARRSKKTRKFLQARGARLNNHSEEPPAEAEGSHSPLPAPQPPSPPPAPEGLAQPYEPFEVPEEEELPPHAFPFPYQMSPEEGGSDDDAIDPDLMAYLSSLHHEALAPGLDSPDKLVRKRRSQMPQECPVCHKVIHGAGKLPRHMRTHTGEKPFACQVCGVRFTRNDKLKIHMRKHTGERPYSCQHCSARFLHSYDLKNHMHLHTGARPYECYLCHKAFAKDDHLQRHLKGQNCLEVRTRRRRREDPPPPPTPDAPPGIDLSNGRLEGLRLSLARYWGPAQIKEEEEEPEMEMEPEAEEGPQPDGMVPVEMV